MHFAVQVNQLATTFEPIIGAIMTKRAQQVEAQRQK